MYDSYGQGSQAHLLCDYGFTLPCGGARVSGGGGGDGVTCIDKLSVRIAGHEYKVEQPAMFGGATTFAEAVASSLRRKQDAGSLKAVTPSSLRAAFEAAVKGHPLGLAEASSRLAQAAPGSPQYNTMQVLVGELSVAKAWVEWAQAFDLASNAPPPTAAAAAATSTARPRDAAARPSGVAAEVAPLERSGGGLRRAHVAGAGAGAGAGAASSTPADGQATGRQVASSSSLQLAALGVLICLGAGLKRQRGGAKSASTLERQIPLHIIYIIKLEAPTFTNNELFKAILDTVSAIFCCCFNENCRTRRHTVAVALFAVGGSPFLQPLNQRQSVEQKE